MLPGAQCLTGYQIFPWDWIPPESWMMLGTRCPVGYQKPPWVLDAPRYWMLPEVPSVPGPGCPPYILDATRSQMLNRSRILLWALGVPRSLMPPVPGSPLRTPHCLVARCCQGASWPWYTVTLSFPW